MKLSHRSGGDRFGTHRVVTPKGVLPQQADRLDASLPIFDNELLVDVEALNIDSASFHQIKEACGGDARRIEKHVSDLVAARGKHHNPVTGSGGMLIGRVREVGAKFLEGRHASESIRAGDRIATLVSLTLTPLSLTKVRGIHLEADRVDVEGHAILFQSGICAKLPEDLSETLALAVLDVCGAPAQTAALCKPGQTVVVAGGGGKSGVLCLYEAKKAVGKTGRVIALDYGKDAVAKLQGMPFVDAVETCDARNALAVYEQVRRLTEGKMADVVINVTNIPDTEMSCILSARPRGVVYFFSMATSFTKAALGAEGVGADVTLVMGNGYSPGHADLALRILRESSEIRAIYEKRYGAS
ncbi:MAG: L-erythro-3,5-diaminohexanoate dehydrogenase [Deltaproteobacteria bacterium]|nr:L-erythro-3,5-diaminohexanoate dehydrogenase [Deltaproteobacteria bacterium]